MTSTRKRELLSLLALVVVCILGYGFYLIPACYVYTPHDLHNVHFYWKNGEESIRDFSKLKEVVTQHGNTLVFATNGGIFGTNNVPVGLYVEHGIELVKLNQEDGFGNFYLKPNGVFSLGATGGQYSWDFRICKNAPGGKKEDIYYNDLRLFSCGDRLIRPQ